MPEAPFDLDNASSNPFKVIDPYNPQNTIEGFVFRKPDMRYGMLHITRVNDCDCAQNIWATPKQNYPWNYERLEFKIPKEYHHIEIYDKYDGTNILAYRYKYKDKTFVTYKTRLRPILGSSKFGNFKALWDEMLEKYPEIPKLPEKNECNISFELYGRRNFILFNYEVGLDCVLLFGRGDDGKIISPRTLDVGGVRVPDNWVDVYYGDVEKIKEIYGALEDEMEEGIIKSVDDEGDVTSLDGLEGTVWYFVGEDGALTQKKCKPLTVRDIHLKGAGGVPNHSIYTTIINSFEDMDDPQYEYVVELLEEEFEKEKVEKKRHTILKILSKVRFDKKISHELRKEYEKHPEFDINEDKGMVMRHFAKLYNKKFASKIYTLLWREYKDG